MNVSGADLSNQIASLATGTQTSQMQLQLSVAMLDKQLEQQQIQANALLKMIQQTPSLDGTGQIVNRVA